MKKILLVSMMLAAGIIVQAQSTDQQRSLEKISISHPEKNSIQTVKPALARKMKTKGNETVIAQKLCKDNIVIKIIKDSQGRVYKQIDNNGTQTCLKTPRKQQTSGEESSYSFREDFEGWQEDYGMDWIPEGWTEINTDENKPTQEMLDHNVNNSWYACYTGDGYWTPVTSDGEKEMFIHFTYNSSAGASLQFKAAPQDEWLITPTISVKEGQKLIFDSSVDLGSLLEFDWNSMKFNRDVRESDLEVLISTDNGKEWTRLWSAIDDVTSKMTDSELYASMALIYRNYTIGLEGYEGKDVKFAFRYLNIGTGLSGNSLAIDAVMVGTPLPEARYDLPYGSLMSGLSEDFYALNNNIVILPAYADVEWINKSNSYTTSSEWTFENPESGYDITTTDYNAVISYPYSAMPLPSLTARNGNGTSTYRWGENDDYESFVQYGGCVTGNDGTEYGFGNYDYNRYGFTTPTFSNGSYCFGTGSDKDWGAKVIGVGNIFEKPAAPLYVEKTFLTLNIFDADPEAEFEIKVYPIDGYGDISDPIAYGKAAAKDAYTDIGFYTLPFNMYKINKGEDEQDEKGFELNQDVLFEVSGFAGNEKVRKFSAMTQERNHESGKNFAYLNFELTDSDGSPVTRRYAASDILDDVNTSLLMSLKGAFSFMNTDDNTINLPAEGGSEIITMASFYDPSAWWTIIDGKKYTFDNPITSDWLTIEPQFDEKARMARITFKAEASAKERSKSFTIETHGAKQCFTVNQNNTSGITSVTDENQEYISINGDVVSVTCNKHKAGKPIMIFNSNGLLTGQTSIDTNGRAKIDMSAQPQGVYLIKTGEKTFKIIK